MVEQGYGQNSGWEGRLTRYLWPDKLKQGHTATTAAKLIKLYGYSREEASVSSLAAYYEPASKVNCKKHYEQNHKTNAPKLTHPYILNKLFYKIIYLNSS